MKHAPSRDIPAYRPCDRLEGRKGQRYRCKRTDGCKKERESVEAKYTANGSVHAMHQVQRTVTMAVIFIDETGEVPKNQVDLRAAPLIV